MAKLARIELTDAGAEWVGKGRIAILSRHYAQICKQPLPARLGRTFDLLGLKLCIVDAETSPPWMIYVSPAGASGKWIATYFRLARILGAVLYNFFLILGIWGLMDWPDGVIPEWRYLKWPWRKR